MPQLYRMFKYRMIIKCHKFDQYDCTAAVTQRLSWPLPPAVYMTLDSDVFIISTNQLISDPSEMSTVCNALQGIIIYDIWSYIGCGLNVYKWGVKLIQLITPGFADGNTNTVSFHWNWETVKIYWNSDSQESRDSAKDISLELLSHNMYICAARFLLTKPTFSLGRIDKKTAFEGSARIVFGKQLGWYETPRSTTAWKVTFLFLPSDESTLHSTAMCREYKILKNCLDSTGKDENACIAILLSCRSAQGQIGHPALLISYFALTLYLWLSFMHLTN